MRKPPEKVWLVQQEGARLRYAQKGGGLFRRKYDALVRAARLRNQGRTVLLLEGTVTWEVVDGS